MSSTTAVKKEVIDFLWEWAEAHNDWGKLLVSNVVTKGTSLSSDERESIFNYFLQSIGLLKDLPAREYTKPTYQPTTKNIKLVSLSEVTGVNKLATKQAINFGKNLTVVYGENGTGKTGYGRILKNLGFCYEENRTILSNIFGEPEPKSASISFISNGTSTIFNWNGSNRNSDLANISVFNNNCVDISLKDRRLIVTPIGFHLFNIIISELSELEKLLNTKISTYPTSISWADQLNIGTPQQQFITALSEKATIEELNKLSNFTDSDEAALKTAESALSQLNGTLLQNEIRTLFLCKTELSAVIQKINTAKSTLNVENIMLLADYSKKINALEGKTKIGIKEVAEKHGVQMYETKEFQSFIKAAEDYIQIVSLFDDSHTEHCIYCKQSLGTSAKELLSSYRTLLNDKTQDELKQAKLDKQALIDKVYALTVNHVFTHPIFGVDENQKAIQPEKITTYNEKINLIRSSFIDGKLTEESLIEFNHDDYINFFTSKNNNIDTIVAEKKQALANLGSQENQLKNIIVELKGRKLLSQKKAEVEKSIQNHKITSLLKSNASSFNSKSISAKTTKAREELVKQNFNQLFENELKALRKSSLKIQLNFETSKGESQVLQNIGSHPLKEILSEGEQKAISLAEFLTELQLDNSKAPVIFDDPVNSLDHNILDDVARRLMRLSNDRQVVIFTHSILLFYSIIQLRKQSEFKSTECSLYNTRNEYELTGYISDAEEEVSSPKSFIAKINAVLNNSSKDKPEKDVAAEGYGYLRSAIELCVEHEILCATVKRYQKNIIFGAFTQIDGQKLNTHKTKLNEIFERCCGFIIAHSNPTEVIKTPTVAELKSDFADFLSIRKEFTG